MLSSRAIRRLICLTLMVLPLTSCRSLRDDVTWEYTIPDGYNGWLAIQYNCPNGVPFNRKDNVIKVAFGADGLFCTSDSPFAWQGQEIAKNTSGTKIPVTFDYQGAYGVCCLQRFGSQVTEQGQMIEVKLDVMWVGPTQAIKPELGLIFDKIDEDMRAGQLVPADW